MLTILVNPRLTARIFGPGWLDSADQDAELRDDDYTLMWIDTGGHDSCGNLRNMVPALGVPPAIEWKSGTNCFRLPSNPWCRLSLIEK
jgi:hypothetical protein